jgi:membrane associated rhomboid family serine protease
VLPLQDVIPPRTAPLATRAIVLASVSLVLIDGLFADIPGMPPLAVSVLNVAYLWLFGENVEDRLGHVPFTAFYAICSVVGGAAHALVGDPAPWAFLASSSATAAVLGAYAVLFRGSRVLVLVPVPLSMIEVPALFFIGLFPVVSAPFGLSLPLQIVAGFAAGGLLCLVLRRPPRW